MSYRHHGQRPERRCRARQRWRFNNRSTAASQTEPQANATRRASTNSISGAPGTSFIPKGEAMSAATARANAPAVKARRTTSGIASGSAHQGTNVRPSSSGALISTVRLPRPGPGAFRGHHRVRLLARAGFAGEPGGSSRVITIGDQARERRPLPCEACTIPTGSQGLSSAP